MNLEQVRKRNRSSILNCINECGPMSRKDIALKTGLTPAAVTQITTSILEEGLLKEIGNASSDGIAGRKKVLLDIDYKCRYIFGVNIETDATTIVLSDLAGIPEDKVSILTETGIAPETFLERISREILGMMKLHAAQKDRIAGISVGIPGIVGPRKSVHAYGIWDREVAVCDILEEATGLSVHLENNVNALARAELLYGIGKTYDNLFLIKWGPGVGGAIIMDRHLFEGREKKAAELGHYIVKTGGKQCICGRKGCLETMVNHEALQAFESFEMKDFGSVYENAGLKEKEAFDEAIRLFARSIVNTVTIIAPNRVVLCGQLFSSEIVRNRLRDYCREYDPEVADRILYAMVADREDYIGPIAAFTATQVF